MFGKRKHPPMKTKLVIEPTPIDIAIERAKRHVALCSDIQLRIHAAEAELGKVAESDSDAALAALEAGTELPAADRTATLTAQIDVLRRALVKADSQARGATTSIYAAAAAAERVLAEEKRERCAQIREKNRKPLAELSLNEGVAFTEYILDCQPQGIWEGIFSGAEPDFNTCGPGDVICRGGGINPQPWFIRSSRRLDAEIKAHEARAVELAQRQIDPGGDLAVVLETVIREVTPAPAAMATEAA
jgi:hypothetical protein